MVSVDPAGQFASPYTGIGNNPVMMVDPDGELARFVPLIYAGVNVAADAIRGDIDSWGDFGKSFGIGLLQGTLAAIGPAGISTWQGALLSTGSSQLLSANVTVGNTAVGISPFFVYGDGPQIGANIFGSAQFGDFSIGGSLTTLGGRNQISGRPGIIQILGAGVGYNNGDFGLSYSRSSFTNGGFNNQTTGINQTTGTISASYKRVTVAVENDIFGDGEDRGRTTALKLGGRVNEDLELFVGVNLATGNPGNKRNRSIDEKMINGKNRKYYNSLGANSIDQGFLYAGASFGGQEYRAGIESPKVRAAIQNDFWHNFVNKPYFLEQNRRTRLYGRFSSKRLYTLY